jgi:hypothetical protein
METTQVDRLSSSLTEGWRAFDHFSARCAAFRRFATYLNDDPAHDSVLFFHGDGGIGKSLLRRHPRGRSNQRFDRNDVRAPRKRLTG